MPVRSIFLAMPDRRDLKRFAKRTIQADSTCFSFYKLADGTKSSLKVNDWTTDNPFFVPIETLLQKHSVRSFLLIQNDTILQSYFGENTAANTLHSSYSIAKCFTASLIGIAIDEGHISSEKALVADYIPELPPSPYLNILTIEQLLNHTSGIKHALTLDATIYYGDNLLKALKRIKYAHKPGTKQHYINLNTQLLGLILHRATGRYPSEYLAQKIWQPIQMCSDGIWATDRKNKLEKTYCCLGATALDYAKFGRLYLNEGQWNGRQIISKSWFNKSIERDTTEGSSFNFNYNWHIGLKEYGDYMAIGMYKQHIYINPKKKVIIVLLNNREKRLKASLVNWWDVFRQIADQL